MKKLIIAFVGLILSVQTAYAAPENYPKRVQGVMYQTERALLEFKYPDLYHDYYWDLQEMLQAAHGSECTGDKLWYGYTRKGSKCFSGQRWAVRSTSKFLNAK